MSGQLRALAAPGAHWKRGWLGHRTNLDDVEKRKKKLFQTSVQSLPLGWYIRTYFGRWSEFILLQCSFQFSLYVVILSRLQIYIIHMKLDLIFYTHLYVPSWHEGISLLLM
jgi:hypothetical protein